MKLWFCEEKLTSGIIQYGACDVSFIALLQSAIPLLLFVNGPLNPKYTIDFLLHSSVCYNLFLSYFFSGSIIYIHFGRQKLYVGWLPEKSKRLNLELYGAWSFAWSFQWTVYTIEWEELFHACGQIELIDWLRKYCVDVLRSPCSTTPWIITFVHIFWFIWAEGNLLKLSIKIVQIVN